MLFSLYESLGLLYEDTEVRNATSASNKIMQNMYTTLNSCVWGIIFITGQPTVPKFGKRIDAIMFICIIFVAFLLLRTRMLCKLRIGMFISWNMHLNIMT